jgi:5'-3' exonuclease
LARYSFPKHDADLGVALLPFIDEQRLLSAMEPLWKGLTEEELIRNEMGSDVLYVAQGNKLYDVLADTFYAMSDDVPVFQVRAVLITDDAFESKSITKVNRCGIEGR